MKPPTARRVLGAAAALALFAGCDRRPLPEPVTKELALAGGKTVSAAVLEQGRQVYVPMCAPCHGDAGRGDGPAAATMRPPPRNFQQGLFKFANTGSGNLPSDAALAETIRRGLQGTPMLPWDLPAERRHALIQYLKTFSTRWAEEEVPPEVEVSEDPWEGRELEAIAKGEAVYHVAGAGHAGCGSCHPAYVSKKRLSALYEQVNGAPLENFAEAPFRAQLRDTEYGVRFDAAGEPEQMHRILPTDFLFKPVKRVRPVNSVVDGKPYTAQMQRHDLYVVIAGGIGGAAMPMWKGALPEENLWALVYYVQSLVEKRSTTEAMRIRQALLKSDEAP